MSNDLPDVGKVDFKVFDEVIFPHLGKRRDEVLVGPQNGVDIAVTDLGHNQVMVTTTDPISMNPPLGWKRAAWLALHIIASDVVTSGFAPQYLSADFNLPRELTRDDWSQFWEHFADECERIGMTVISGHTGRYDGCNYPMVGGATAISIGPRDRYIAPNMAKVGDKVVLTKGAAVETAGLFGAVFRQKIEAAYGKEFADEAEEYFWQMSTVKDGLVAVQAGVRDEGVTSMHDATEGGVLGGIWEVANASRVGVKLSKDDIPLHPVAEKVCRLFELDPYIAISEGTMIITVRPHKEKELLSRLEDEGIPAATVGELVEADEGMTLYEGSKRTELVHPRVDPFWEAFSRNLAELAD